MAMNGDEPGDLGSESVGGHDRARMRATGSEPVDEGAFRELRPYSLPAALAAAVVALAVLAVPVVWFAVPLRGAAGAAPWLIATAGALVAVGVGLVAYRMLRQLF